MQSANQSRRSEAQIDAAELVALANSLMAGATLTESDATIHALFTHQSGDPTLLDSYRPVARPSAKREALGRLLTNRLKEVPYWPPLQYTAVEGQHTEDSLGVLQMALTRIIGGKEPPALMVVVDLEHAWNKVSHDYLYELLERANFGPGIINYVKGLFANARVIISVNGIDTDPIKLGRGFVHGDPAAPCLFSAAMQPLLTLLEEEGLGITLGGDDGAQLKVPYLATPEHLITFVQRPEQLAVLQRQLDIFANASDAAMFENKIKAIVLSSADGDPAALAELERACPWPIVAPEEFDYLGHDINLRTGGVAKQALAAKLDEVRLESDIDAPGSMSHFERVKMAKTALLPPLWSNMSLTPHPIGFGAKVIKSLGPWEWPMGERMSVKDLTRPQRLGGLGLPDPDKMLIATTGAAIVRFLRRQDDIGTFFRRCLHDYLRDEQGLSEASLLLHEGETFETRINSRRLAQDSFWANVVWTLAQLSVSLDEDWSKYKLPELLVLPYAYPAFGKDPRFRKVNNFVNASQRDRLDLWGDIAWGKEVDGQQTPTLMPPSRSAMLRYKHQLRCSEARDKSVGDMAHFIELDWERWFATLPQKVQELLKQMPDEYELTAGTSGENADDGSSSVRPFEWDLDDIEYPWHLNKVAGLTLEDFTVERAYAKLAPSELIRPGV